MQMFRHKQLYTAKGAPELWTPPRDWLGGSSRVGSGLVGSGCVGWSVGRPAGPSVGQSVGWWVSWRAGGRTGTSDLGLRLIAACFSRFCSSEVFHCFPGSSQVWHCVAWPKHVADARELESRFPELSHKQPRHRSHKEPPPSPTLAPSEHGPRAVNPLRCESGASAAVVAPQLAPPSRSPGVSQPSAP